MKRDDEEFAKNALADFLSESIQFLPGPYKKTPDYWAELTDGTRIAVEITQLSPITFDGTGAMHNRNTEDISILRALDKIEKKLNVTFGSSNKYTLLLVLSGPFTDFNNFKEVLYAHLSTALTNKTLLIGTSQKFEIEGQTIEIKVLCSNCREFHITPLLMNRNSNCDIGLNARHMLTERIAQKNQKLRNIAEHKWLVLLNDYPLADHNTYKRAFAAITVSHVFDKIFVIHKNKFVQVLFP